MTSHLRLDVVEHLPLRLNQHGHVQEDLVQVQQAASLARAPPRRAPQSLASVSST